MKPLLHIQDLSVDYSAGRKLFGKSLKRRVLFNFSLQMHEGETVGLVGESGSGKSTVGQVILGNVPVAEGTVRVGDWHLERFSGGPPRAYRGVVQMMWQNPQASLTPTMRIGALLQEALNQGAAINQRWKPTEASSLLQRVGLMSSDAEKYPHEFSGGQQQRIALARTLALQPRLIVLDEATSALDVITQSQILALLKQIQQETGVAYLLISHDLGVVRCMAKRIVVLNQGEIMEAGDVDSVCDSPTSSYTRTLINSVLEPP